MTRLLKELRRFKEDRAVMASLRCTLVKTKQHRAWPALNRLGVPVKDRVAAVVAALYATHPEETSDGNFGDTCLAIQRSRNEKKESNDKDSKLTPIERRFLYLLAAERGKELHERVARMVFMAKSQGVPINFARLEGDLRFWNENKKTDWAAHFWTPKAAKLPSTAEEGAVS